MLGLNPSVADGTCVVFSEYLEEYMPVHNLSVVFIYTNTIVTSVSCDINWVCLKTEPCIKNTFT